MNAVIGLEHLKIAIQTYTIRNEFGNSLSLTTFCRELMKNFDKTNAIWFHYYLKSLYKFQECWRCSSNRIIGVLTWPSEEPINTETYGIVQSHKGMMLLNGNGSPRQFLELKISSRPLAINRFTYSMALT